MDLIKLKSFLYAAEEMSFSGAAKQLHLTQPTISHHIKVLESDLGIKLFERSGSQFQITEAGRSLLPWARKLIQDSYEMQEMMASLQDGIVGHLRIACSTTSGKYILPQLAARFCKQHPGIRASILSCTTGNIVSQLLEGEASLGVISSEAHDENYEYQVFFNDSISLIVPANHPWAFRRFIEPGELLNENLIMREHTSGTRRVMLSELAKHDISLEDLNVFMELSNAEAIVRTVAAGYGISFVSTLASACPLERGNVIDIEVSGLHLQRTIYMIRKRFEAPNRPQEAFWSFIHDPSNQDLLSLAGEQP